VARGQIELSVVPARTLGLAFEAEFRRRIAVEDRYELLGRREIGKLPYGSKAQGALPVRERSAAEGVARRDRSAEFTKRLPSYITAGRTHSLPGGSR
jgi:hypothetical protein